MPTRLILDPQGVLESSFLCRCEGKFWGQGLGTNVSRLDIQLIFWGKSSIMNLPSNFCIGLLQIISRKRG